MSLLGKVELKGSEYFLCYKRNKSEEYYYLISKVHKDDIVGYSINGEYNNPLLTDNGSVIMNLTRDYIIGGIKRSTKSGRIWGFGSVPLLNQIMEEMRYAKFYQFRKDAISIDSEKLTYGSREKSFQASDMNLYYSFMTTDGVYSHLVIKNQKCNIELTESNLNISKSMLTKGDERDSEYLMVELVNDIKKKISINTLDSITYDRLRDLLDLSWYQLDTGEYVKKYTAIENVRDFELRIITPIAKELERVQGTDEEVLIAVDTETTGLAIYNLSKDNPDLDHCVAIPICWKDDESYVIFTDMEFFDNVDNQYAINRLATLFENFAGERTIEYYEEIDNEESNESVDSLNTMDLFGDVSIDDDLDNTFNLFSPIKGKKIRKRSIIFKRSNINLIGHNAIFDGKVFFSYGKEFYFNNDTLQMAFNLNPKMIKASNKLKALTRRIFGHETPELSDVLGKGNEDKYKYIADKRVAEIYGCADADYTRKLFKHLKSITTPKMYQWYQQQDIPLMNILYKSEYYGMRTTEDKVLELAETSRRNIEKLKEFMYGYVGTMVAYNEQRNLIDEKYRSGIYKDYDEYKHAIDNIHIPADSKYIFEVKDATKRHVMYDILKYKIYAWTDGKNPLPKTDKYVMKKLSKEKRDGNSVGFGHMDRDLITVDITRTEYDRLLKTNKKLAEEYCLISAKEFNECKNPLAVALLKYSELDKEYTSYYKPIVEKNLEGKMFYGYSMARIETRRIANPGQTMKGKLKALIRAYTDDYYLLDFDMSQAEYRIMVSLAKYESMIRKMNNPESDYHIETASLVHDVPAHMVSKKLRKQTKSISFGVPYGLSEHSLCENIFGTVNEDTLFSTRLLLKKWYSSNQPISDMLDEFRANALVEQEISKDLRDFMGAYRRDDDGEFELDSDGNKIPIKLGFIKNPLDFYRAFELDDLEKGRKSSIERAAGNFPIQSFAAEVFRIILIRFYNRCEKEGINDKIIWHMLIHDELLCSVHKSLNPFYMYKLVKESCMVSFKGHTKYFIGINIGNTWAETKDDAREAPIYFVDRIIKRWDDGEWANGPYWFDNPWEFIKPYREQFVEDRIYEVVKEIQDDIDTKPINIPLLLSKFTNYTVRAYVKDYKMNHEINTALIGDQFSEDDLEWASMLESWMLDRFGEGKLFIDCDLKIKEVKRQGIKVLTADDIHDDIDLEALFSSDDNAFTFDDSELGYTYDFDVSTYNNTDADEAEQFNYEADGKSIADFIKTETKYSNISEINKQFVIKCQHTKLMSIAQDYLKKYVDDKGYSVVFKGFGMQTRWLRITPDVDLHNLDNFLTKCNSMSNAEFATFLKQKR